LEQFKRAAIVGCKAAFAIVPVIQANVSRSERPVLTLGTNEASVFPKPKNAMLPILVVLFLISYGLMSVLVVEQGRTIDSQRHLIRDLFNDSVQLSALKTKELLRQRATPPPPVQKAPVKGPVSQASPQVSAKNNAPKSQRPVLQKPPKLTTDTADSRRIPLTI
jgi:hypothetical protein